MNDKLLTVKQAADRLQVCDRHVRTLINAGELIVIRVGWGAKSDRIAESELERFIVRRKTNRGASEWVSTGQKVVSIGAYASPSTSKKLDDLLGPPTKRKRKRSSGN